MDRPVHLLFICILDLQSALHHGTFRIGIAPLLIQPVERVMARLFDEAVDGVCQQYACGDRDQQVNFMYESGGFHPIDHDISDILVDQVDRI